MRSAEPMWLVLGVWVCTLPFVFLLLAPRLGFKVAGATVLVLFAVALGLCWRLCFVRRTDVRTDRGEPGRSPRPAG